MIDDAQDAQLLRQVHQALRHYHDERRLAEGRLLGLLGWSSIPGGMLRRAIAVRLLLNQALDRLAAEDEILSHLLQLRFLQGKTVLELELQGWARSTLFRHQRRAITRLARILLETSGPGPALEPALFRQHGPGAAGRSRIVENAEARSPEENGLRTTSQITA